MSSAKYEGNKYTSVLDVDLMYIKDTKEATFPLNEPAHAHCTYIHTYIHTHTYPHAVL